MNRSRPPAAAEDQAAAETRPPPAVWSVPAEADVDPAETREWMDSFDAVVHFHGRERARYLLDLLRDRARAHGAERFGPLVTDYVNTLAPQDEPPYPGDLDLEFRITNINRWNAAVMVSRANKLSDGIGGHISTYASCAWLYEVGFHHFFRGKDGEGTGDQIYYQGHASPGIYARSFLAGDMDRALLERFRREAERGKGISSYPHARLMPGYWEFPTVSMGLGPIAATYQARFNRYLQARGIVNTADSRVWCFLGDGETDEPESLGQLTLAAREGLDNLTFVVNCNLQRLDGPVRGNGKIVQELEAVFRGAGWNVIKVLWGRSWDPIFERDTYGVLRRALNETVDGELQRFGAESDDVRRREFFERHPELLRTVAHLDDDQLSKLERGGHDPWRVHAAYRAAVAHKGRPTVILVQTVKGFRLGDAFAARNSTHQMKKLSPEQLRDFRDRLELPLSDADCDDYAFYHPGEDSAEVRYLRERRAALGGPLPRRRTQVPVSLDLPGRDVYEEFYGGTGKKGGASTTMVMVRLLTKLLRDEGIGRRVVPIVPDEARTFGMESLFKQVGIYAPFGQLYEPVDRAMLMYYREARDGQILEEGITEAGSMASFTAAGTAHATHGEPMIPFYFYYSMFGFQRTGDQAWAFADCRGRGFLCGATAGRTTLNGEGLQHEDGHSHVLAATIPSILAYDPAFAYEIAVIVEDGLRRMWDEGQDVFYYLTLQNEPYPMPKMPEGVREGIVRGLYRFRIANDRRSCHVQLFGSGVIINEVLRAADLLASRFDVSSDVWSATSYQQLRDDALACERWNRLHPEETPRTSYLQSALEGVEGPFVAASDYMKLVPDQIARWVPGRFVPLGTDGFGMSDTREALRRHFEVDAECIAVAALHALARDGAIDASVVARAIRDLGIDPEKIDPMSV